ncbi:MAG: hypothetical protein HXY43_06515 [Fischerella sp.]|uniref:hypothetical protein n=1 Tax=unclassified Fischerella TaxID=494603 RepID=UPI00047CD41B|nr:MULTISPECIES: hypothetical protein [unclassified Fischerella]NWF58956.1 hypothetical protein [Fischerella sp.]
MRFKLLSLGLFSVTAVSPFFMPSLTPSALAGCTAVDVSAQVSVDRSREGNQSNQTNQNFGENCENSVGGTVTSVGTQTCVSGGRCEQRRNSNQFVDGDPNSNVPVRTRNIGIKVNPQIHVPLPSNYPR